MMKRSTITFIITGILIIGLITYLSVNKVKIKGGYEVGEPIDSLNHVYVYYNGNVGNVSGRNRAKDGYNIGLKYQCVEFVKRYYYQHMKHKMPNSYGHAKDFFNARVKDGKINKDRALRQYTNPSSSKPRVHDLVVYKPTIFNKYGHVAIVSEVTDSRVEIIQQNAGVGVSSRATYKLVKSNGKWKIKYNRIVGWLRK